MKQEKKEEPTSESEFIQFDYQTTLGVENSADENCFEDDQDHDILFHNPKKIRKEKRKYK